MSAGPERPYLLDVNVLVALFDPGHIHHDTVHHWFAAHGVAGWASCPLTENGFVRVLSNPAYPGRRTTVADAAARLLEFAEGTAHVFWSDDVSLLDPERFDIRALGGHRGITDAYLLGLAVRNSGALVTLDQGIRRDAVRGAEPQHIVHLPG